MCPSELLSTSLSDCGSLTSPVRTPFSPAVFKYASTEGEEVEGEMESKGRVRKEEKGRLEEAKGEGRVRKNIKNEGGMETKGEGKRRRVKEGCSRLFETAPSS